MSDGQRTGQFTSDLFDWRHELSKPARAAIEERQIRRKFSAGEALFLAGDTATCAFQIVDGLTMVTANSREGRQMIISSNGPGDCLGDLALVSDFERINNLIAITNGELAILRRRDFKELTGDYPELLVAMNRLLARRFQFVHCLIQEAYLLPLRDRLGRTIIRLCLDRYDPRQSDGSFLRLDSISQEALAEMVGGARQSIGRELKKMEKEGFILIGYKCIYITNLSCMSKEFGRYLSFDDSWNRRIQEFI